MSRSYFAVALFTLAGLFNPAAFGTAIAADASPAAEPPTQLVNATPKGQLKNPYTDYEAVAEAGHKQFLHYGCNGCHGGTGGGGMCPLLTNPIWVYGADDDTLFRLVTLGSDTLQKQGYARKGQELVVGPMPPFGGIIKTSDDLWKIIAWIRSINPDSLKAGQPTSQPQGANPD
jgi:mono/diheme cytochrome c family protein